MSKTNQKGFTLVELAIVLTIIGLLIGGILKGQQLMQNARVTATLSQVQAIESATTTFRDTYSAVPGDMLNADNRLPNCANCGLALPAVTAGDGMVGPTGWNMVVFNSASAALAADAATAAQETVLFWYELAQAGLLSGVTSEGITTTTTAFGSSLPAARVGGGFTVGNANTATAAIPGRPAALLEDMSGTVLTLMQTPAAVSATAGVQVMTPNTAAQMDRKMDDGMPGTGFVQAYGVTGSCYSVAAPFTAAVPGYLESTTAKNCGLYFRIQQ